VGFDDPAERSAPPTDATDDVRFELSPLDGVALEKGDLRLRLGGRFAPEWIQYDDRNTRDPRLDVGRAVVRLDAAWQDWLTGRVEADLDGRDSRAGLFEGWVAVQHELLVRLTVGQIKVPLSLEHTIAEERLPFMDYAFPSFLGGRHDVGVRVDGEVAEGLFSYDLTAVIGEGFDQFGQRRGDPQLAGRVMLYPLRWVDASVGPDWYRIPLVSGLFVTGAYAYSPDYDGHLDVATSFRNKLFVVPGLDGDGARSWYFGYGIDWGPLRLMHEFTRGSIFELEVPGGGTADFDDQITSWQASAHWTLTGEPYDTRSFRQREKRREGLPRLPVWRPAGEDGPTGPGAWEVAFRYANADIDRDFVVFGFTDTTVSSQEFRTADVAVNWYPVRALRIAFQVTAPTAAEMTTKSITNILVPMGTISRGGRGAGGGRWGALMGAIPRGAA